MSNPMQEFSPQLPQHHPFSLGHEASSHRSSHSSPRSPASGSTSHSSHPTGHSFMHDPIVYGSLNRQSLGYNMHVIYEMKFLKRLPTQWWEESPWLCLMDHFWWRLQKQSFMHKLCRIGLMFYQHKNLHFANHGLDECRKKTEQREFRTSIRLMVRSIFW